MNTQLLVTADDSTGATEAAAACADAGWGVEVVPFTDASSAAECVVVDLRSRHVPPLEARRRIIAAAPGVRHVHKIDSTLRGNWAAELEALVEVGRRVLLIPSHPPLGRVCVGGVVLVNGVPVAETEHGNDPRLPVRTSRPGDSLAGVKLAGAGDVAAWLAAPDEAAGIADAATIDDIDQLVAAARGAADVVIAGPASVVGAVARAWSPRSMSPLPRPWLPAPIVAVCASLHSASRAQMAALGVADLGVEMVMSPDDRAGDADAIATDVAARAHRLVGELRARSVILIGGDTAAAFIGDARVAVFGSVGAGISLGEAMLGTRRLRLACKPGGFGTANTLVDLVTRNADMTSTLPMAITMGDASGVGPEIVLRRAADGAFVADPVVVYGDLGVLRRGAELLGVDPEIEAIADPAQWRPGPLQVMDAGMLQAIDHHPGEIDAATAAAARQYVLAATRDALAGRVAGLVTMPMNKEATQLTDPEFVGHTELIAAACGVQRFTMMLTAGDLAVTHVSTHVSLIEAIRRVTTARVTEVIELTHETLHRFIDRPRIAVCGLNPHAGEHGLFGSEDATHIVPAIEAARAAGIDASGPHPADTVFHQAVHRKRFDAIVCMYHDQGHTPMKLLAFESGVNVTVGLPIVRTSVDHGTAYDIAWQGVAFTGSLDHALGWARRLSNS